MSARLSRLARFKDSSAQAQPEEAEAPLLPHSSHRGQEVLAIDQSIASTGWAIVMGASEDPVWRVVRTGMVQTRPTKARGFSDTYARTAVAYEGILDVLLKHEPAWVVHEMPPVGYGMRRPDSSLLMAQVVRCAVLAMEDPLVVRMLSANRVKARLTGDANAEKPQVREAVNALIPTLPDGQVKPLNHDVYDAIALGIVAISESSEVA